MRGAMLGLIHCWLCSRMKSSKVGSEDLDYVAIVEGRF